MAPPSSSSSSWAGLSWRSTVNKISSHSCKLIKMLVGLKHLTKGIPLVRVSPWFFDCSDMMKFCNGRTKSIGSTKINDEIWIVANGMFLRKGKACGYQECAGQRRHFCETIGNAPLCLMCLYLQVWCTLRTGDIWTWTWVGVLEASSELFRVNSDRGPA